MTSFIFGLLLGSVIGFGAAWWSYPRMKVLKRQTDWSWPGKPMRIVEHDPSELPLWGGRE